MPWTTDTFLKRAPAFKCVSAAAIQFGLDEAERCTNRKQWGVKADDAVFYLAAHLITVNTRLSETGATGGLSMPAGPVTSERLLGWSASYAGPSSSMLKDSLSSTAWGRHFQSLRSVQFSNRCI